MKEQPEEQKRPFLVAVKWKEETEVFAFPTEEYRADFINVVRKKYKEVLFCLSEETDEESEKK